MKRTGCTRKRKSRGGATGTSLTGPLNSRGFHMTPMGVVAPKITVFNGGKRRATRRRRGRTHRRRH